MITAGTAIRESLTLIEAAGAQASAVFLALDRQERGQIEGGMTDTSAIQQVEQEFGLPVIAIATLNDLIDYLKQQDDQEQQLEKMREYRERYGID